MKDLELQVFHKSRDEGATKYSFEKIHEYYLFLFLTRAPLLLYVDRVLPRWNHSLIKGNRWWHLLLSRDNRRY